MFFGGDVIKPQLCAPSPTAYTYTVAKLKLILTQRIWLFRFSGSSAGDEVLKVLWVKRAVPIEVTHTSPTSKQRHGHIWSAVSSPQARTWLRLNGCVCVWTACENLGSDVTPWSMYIPLIRWTAPLPASESKPNGRPAQCMCVRLRFEAMGQVI